MPPLIAPSSGRTGALGRFWRWWSSELLGLIPSGLSGRLGRRDPPVEISILQDETRIEQVKDGYGERLADPRPIDQLDDEAWEQLGALIANGPVRLVLAPPDVYATELTLPRSIGARLRQAIALQMAELAPITPDLLRWNAVPIGRDGEWLRVGVAMARVERLEALEVLFTARGLVLPDIWAAIPDGHIPIVISGRRGMDRLRSPWLTTLLLLFSIPVTTTVAASVIAWSNEHRAALVADAADRMMRAEAKARSVELLRQALAPLARQLAASQILDDLAQRLPADASLVEAKRDERGILTLSIDAADPDLVRTALDADPLFRFAQTNEANGADGRLRLMFIGQRR